MPLIQEMCVENGATIFDVKSNCQLCFSRDSSTVLNVLKEMCTHAFHCCI